MASRITTAGMLLLGALVALLLTAAPAGAGAEDLGVKSAKHKDGPYRVDTRINMDVGETRSLWWRVKSKGSSVQKVQFDEPTDDTDGYRVRWYRGNDDITTEVNDDEGYRFGLQAGRSVYFQAELKRRPAGDVACLYGEATNDLIAYVAATASINDTCTF